MHSTPAASTGADHATAEDWARCAASAGVLDRYEAFDGTECRAPQAAVRRALAAMGVSPRQPLDDAGFPACVVLREGEPLAVQWRCADPAAAAAAPWDLC